MKVWVKNLIYKKYKILYRIFWHSPIMPNTNDWFYSFIYVLALPQISLMFSFEQFSFFKYIFWLITNLLKLHEIFGKILNTTFVRNWHISKSILCKILFIQSVGNFEFRLHKWQVLLKRNTKHIGLYLFIFRETFLKSKCSTKVFFFFLISWQHI